LVKLVPFAIQGDAHGNQWIGKCSSLVRPGPDPPACGSCVVPLQRNARLSGKSR
jgi:hypothetical protein